MAKNEQDFIAASKKYYISRDEVLNDFEKNQNIFYIYCKCEKCGNIYKTTALYVKRHNVLLCIGCREKVVNFTCKICNKASSSTYLTYLKNLDVCSSCRNRATRQNWTPEKKEAVHKKRLEQARNIRKNKTPEELKSWYKKISNQKQNRTQEEIDSATEKSRKTRMKKYNGKFIDYSLVESTLMKRYGVRTYFKAKDFVKKQKATKLARYGDENYNNHAKYEKTCLDKYGVKSTNQVGFIIDKQQRSNHINYVYDNNVFNSYQEVCYFAYQKDLGHKIIRSPGAFEYQTDDGEMHLYYPDFLDNGVFVEIKGDHFFDNEGDLYSPYSKKKLLEKQACMKAHNVKIIRSSDCSQYIEYCETKYGSTFRMDCKIYKNYHKKEKING